MAYITIFLKVFKGLLFFQYKYFIIYKDFIEQTKSILLNLLCFVYNKLETVLYAILFSIILCIIIIFLTIFYVPKHN